MKKYMHPRSEKTYTIEDNGYSNMVVVKSKDGDYNSELRLHRDKLSSFYRDLDEYGFIEVTNER